MKPHSTIIILMPDPSSSLTQQMERARAGHIKEMKALREEIQMEKDKAVKDARRKEREVEHEIYYEKLRKEKERWEKEKKKLEEDRDLYAIMVCLSSLLLLLPYLQRVTFCFPSIRPFFSVTRGMKPRRPKPSSSKR